MSEFMLPDVVRASVFSRPGAPSELRCFELPALSGGDALVRVECSTLCGSDLHTYLGRRSAPTPTILGHEIVGRIAAFGPDHPRIDCRGESLAVGDRVSWTIAASCGECFFCRHGLPQKCERLFKYGHQACDALHPLSGGLAEFCQLVAGSAIVRVPEGIPDTVASSANCAFATAAAALRTAGGCAEKSVLIQGAGLLGLAATAMAHSAGAKCVLVTDVDHWRLEWPRRFGASETIRGNRDSCLLSDAIMNATDGRGVDLAVEMSGSIDAFPIGLNSLRTGGCYVLIGAVKPVGTTPLDVEQIVRRMWRIEGVHNYVPADLVAAIDFLAACHAQYPFRELISAEYSLDQVDAAFAHMLRTKAVRVAVRPRGTCTSK